MAETASIFGTDGPAYLWDTPEKAERLSNKLAEALSTALGEAGLDAEEVCLGTTEAWKWAAGDLEKWRQGIAEWQERQESFSSVPKNQMWIYAQPNAQFGVLPPKKRLARLPQGAKIVAAMEWKRDPSDKKAHVLHRRRLAHNGIRVAEIALRVAELLTRYLSE